MQSKVHFEFLGLNAMQSYNRLIRRFKKYIFVSVVSQYRSFFGRS